MASEANFVVGLRVAGRRLVERVRIRHQAELLSKSPPRTGTAIIVSVGLAASAVEALA